MPLQADALDELVTANHILVSEGVVDSFGHISIRHGETLTAICFHAPGHRNALKSQPLADIQAGKCSALSGVGTTNYDKVPNEILHQRELFAPSIKFVELGSIPTSKIVPRSLRCPVVDGDVPFRVRVVDK